MTLGVLGDLLTPFISLFRSRRRKVTTLRAVIAKRSLDELGLSMAEIARHVGVTTSSVAKAVDRLEEDG